MPNLEVFDIVKAYLVSNGFEGLYNSDCECACTIDDLMPCGEMQHTCTAGYVVPGCSCGEGCEFHVESKKPPEPNYWATSLLDSIEDPKFMADVGVVSGTTQFIRTLTRHPYLNNLMDVMARDPATINEVLGRLKSLASKPVPADQESPSDIPMAALLVALASTNDKGAQLAAAESASRAPQTFWAHKCAEALRAADLLHYISEV